MTKQSVSAAGDSPTNEELVFRFQSGDPSASELLLRQNSDYLTALAKQYDRRRPEAGGGNSDPEGR